MLQVFSSMYCGRARIKSRMCETRSMTPAMQEMKDGSLGGEDPLEKEIATHSSILAWEIAWTEEPGGLQSMGSQRVRLD